ncbi:hypothetical protein HDZ31DRAFT_47754, partial [Schizophyllum fasciatum]
VQRGTAVRAFRAPYRTMPRIRSRAHPFFVVFYADDQLDMSAALVMPEKKARSLMSPVSRIISCWTAQPPPEFLIGPDVWWPHRHPLSDDGQDEPKCPAPSESRWTHNMITRRAIRTPCPRAKPDITTPKPYARFDPRPARVRGSVLSRPGRQTGNSTTCGLCYEPSAIREWLSGITPTRCSSPSPVEDETCRDVELACYRLEAAREADDALNPYTNEMYSTGLLIGRGNDWSRFSSNNWAMHSSHLRADNGALSELALCPITGEAAPRQPLVALHARNLHAQGHAKFYRCQSPYTESRTRPASASGQRFACVASRTRQLTLHLIQIEHFEYYWGMQKGELDLSSPLNHIQLRADMLAGLEDLQWVFIPTKGILDAMCEMADFNKTASLESRKHFLRVCLLRSRHLTDTHNLQEFPEGEYEYDLDMSAALVMPEKKARALMAPLGHIISCWMVQPPPEFLIGPDVWWSHRHPLSDDGQDEPECPAPPEPRRTHRMITRSATRAPCPPAKAVVTAPKPYARFDPRPARIRGSVLPRPGRVSGDKASGYAPSAIHEWLSDITPKKRTSPPPSQDVEMQRDAELAKYRRESARHADDALNPSTNVLYSGGLIIGYKNDDWSRFSSNNWAILEPSNIVSHRILALDQSRYRRQIEHFEYYWGMQKGELELSSPLNHIQQTSDRMHEMAEFNKRAGLHARKHFLEEFPAGEYEYDVVPLYLLKHRHPLYVECGTAIKAFRAPYRTIPRIRSRIHPFFVSFYASDQLDKCSAMVMPEKKARALMSSVGRIISCWMAQPPPEFLAGPDIWWPHRHPLSDDGHDEPECPAPPKPRRTHGMTTRSATRAPCPLAKSVAPAPKPYARLDPRPADVRGSALHPPGRESGEKATGYEPSAIREWLASITPKNRASPSPPADDGARRDTELASYRREAAREADDALRPLTNIFLNTGLKIGRGDDWSRLSSNNWAMYVRGTCLLSSDLPR